MKYTLRDPSLPHQVVLHFAGQQVTVSCNCRGTKNSQGQTTYPPFGVAVDMTDVERLYNDHGNHRWAKNVGGRGHSVFQPEDEIRTNYVSRDRR